MTLPAGTAAQGERRAATWFGRRARNVKRRPILLGSIAAATFVLSLITFVSIPYLAQPPAAGAASPGTLLAASTTLAVVTGFAVTLLLEIRHPCVADAREAEGTAGAPVLLVLRPRVPLPERRRRRADREISPLIDQVSDDFPLLYAQLADTTFNLPLIAVLGDEPTMIAAVASNLAATAGRNARSALLVDTDFVTHSVARVLRVRPSPGVADALAGHIDWVSAVTQGLVGRDHTIDVLTAGALPNAEIPTGADATIAQELTYLGRRYDSVILSYPTPRQARVPVLTPAARQVIICIRASRTETASLRMLAAWVREHGATVRGLVLWDMDDPVALAPGNASAHRGALELLTSTDSRTGAGRADRA